jgi:pyruvate/2-oxoglutarate/acetoin dehydrogenase E1 component
MKYLEFVNQKIRDTVSSPEKLVLFGQNIAAGSCLGGLTRNIKIQENSMLINSTNTENSLCGFGFGLMMNDVSSVFFMKQLDFLLLGIDHLVNTYNIIRNNHQLNSNTSFTIMPIIMDNGFQGPQSSHNNLGDFCSIARIEGYTITNKLDAEKIIDSKLISPGFRIIGVSQRLFQTELIEPKNLIFVSDDCSVFQYTEGEDVTIVCFNFSFPNGYELSQKLKQNNINSSLFNVNSPTFANWTKIIENVKKTKKIIIIDDSKSVNLNYNSLLSKMCGQINLNKKIILTRNLSNNWLNPIDDQMEIDYNSIIETIKK